ncbi:hypothetical protein W824_08375 [Clavibacter cf. michiganensis LMG 26808]|uniref:Uncharacterized protein n=1 Tax=Clavibacter michiganensis TaxID=28447 RepID=A0A399NS36_9MICO|nr:hypothetical protein W824_08375 [Clavibacter cf. michiganensis LMG 26808]RII96972.1 hypothetical protein DZF96_09240 [Clavibacter michiganensis]
MPVCVDDDALLKMLYIRDVHGLQVAGIPSTASGRRTRTSRSRDVLGAVGRSTHEEALSRQWRDSLHWLVDASHRQELTHRILESGDRSQLRQVLPPAWDERTQSLLDLEGYSEWHASLSPSVFMNTEDGDEPRAALASATKRGLRVIVVLPLSEPHAEEFSAGGMLMSWEVYRGAGSRAAALEGFRGAS